MLKRLKNKLPRLNLYVLLTAMLVFAAASLCILAYLQRVYGLNQLKREINKIQASLAEVGWDMAYDNAESSTFLLSAPLTFKNFRLYALDGSKEWKAEEVKRIKTESGIVEMEEPAIAQDINLIENNAHMEMG